jgi:hypothetical protein
MPVRLTINDAPLTITVAEQPQTHEHEEAIIRVDVDRNFYVDVKKRMNDE